MAPAGWQECAVLARPHGPPVAVEVVERSNAGCDRLRAASATSLGPAVAIVPVSAADMFAGSQDLLQLGTNLATTMQQGSMEIQQQRQELPRDQFIRDAQDFVPSTD